MALRPPWKSGRENGTYLVDARAHVMESTEAGFEHEERPGCCLSDRELSAMPFVAFPHSALHRMPIGGDTMKKFLDRGCPNCVRSGLSICSDHHRFERVLRGSGCTTKKCTIVDKKPTTTTTIVDNGIFKTRTEAETGMKTMKVCTEN